METSGLKLPPQEILVVWDWEWTSPYSDSDIDRVSESSFEDQDHNNPYIQSDIDSDVEKIPEIQLQIRFKCIRQLVTSMLKKHCVWPVKSCLKVSKYQ